MAKLLLSAVTSEYNENEILGWHRTYNAIRTSSDNNECTTLVGSDPNNAHLNRYRTVLPYDHTRVVLEAGSVNYINASVVQVTTANRKYILTQGPLPHTICHFWQMVWEQNCNLIIMLNRVYERKQKSCEEYWPDKEGPTQILEFNESNLVVSFRKETKHSGYCVRYFVIKSLTSLEERNVIQYHMQMWPDFGVPSSLEEFLDFMHDVRPLMTDTYNHPPIVHCSAGIGRSGCFGAIDAAISITIYTLCDCVFDIVSLITLCDFIFDIVKKVELGCERLDISSLIKEMRKSRMGLIQTIAQLRFTYAIIIQLLKERVINEGGEVESLEVIEAPPPVPPRRTESLAAPARPLPPHPALASENDEESSDEEECESEPELSVEPFVMSEPRSESSPVNQPSQETIWSEPQPQTSADPRPREEAIMGVSSTSPISLIYSPEDEGQSPSICEPQPQTSADPRPSEEAIMGVSSTSPISLIYSPEDEGQSPSICEPQPQTSADPRPSEEAIMGVSSTSPISLIYSPEDEGQSPSICGPQPQTSADPRPSEEAIMGVSSTSPISLIYSPEDEGQSPSICGPQPQTSADPRPSEEAIMGQSTQVVQPVEVPRTAESLSLRRRRTEELAVRISEMRKRAHSTDRLHELKRSQFKKIIFVFIVIAMLFAFGLSSLYSSH